MIDYQRLFHTGVLVPDLDQAMDELGVSLGVTWAEAQESAAQRVWTPNGGAHTLPLRFTYSCEYPQHIELLEGPADSIWDGQTNPGVHHQGIWVDDVATETRRFLDTGWELRLSQLSPDEGFGAYTYLQPPTGVLVEFVASAMIPRFERWWAGGTL